MQVKIIFGGIFSPRGTCHFPGIISSFGALYVGVCVCVCGGGGGGGGGGAGGGGGGGWQRAGLVGCVQSQELHQLACLVF